MVLLPLALAACSPARQFTKAKPPPGDPSAAPPAPSNVFDQDSDGVPDAKDRCPAEAEDVDGFEDDDGCPEADNDHDKIPDAADACPLEPEIYNGTQDADGCPD